MSKKNQQVGVDVRLGNKCSRTAYSWAEKTFNNVAETCGKPRGDLKGAYANVLSFGLINLAITSDGIGSKIDVAERLKIYNTMGFDLMAMIVDDLVCVGARPTTISNILDVDHLDHDTVDSLMEGLSQAADVAKVVITGGEIAELGERVSGYGDGMHFNWCATGLGIIDPDDTFIDGRSITEGDVIISLKSPGFRSNGFTAARDILKVKYGDAWHNFSSEFGKWGDILLTPSLIYSPLITELFAKRISINGIVHITGGGIAENLMRLLKVRQLGAVLDNLFPPHESMSMLQSFGNLPEEEVYKHWNMGNGMLLIVPKSIANELLAYIASTKYLAKEVGTIIGDPSVYLHSLGNDSQILRYSLCQN
jgi:phosphoribosylformylglycinamidine cyclo-ligase